MNQLNFYNSFLFNVFRFDKYHITDNTTAPLPRHYLGCLIKGTAKIKTKNGELSIVPGEIFYLPKGLTYQSLWYGDQYGEIAFFSFGFEFSPVNKTFLLQKINCSEKAQALFDELCEEIPFTDQSIGKLYRFFGEVAGGMAQAKKAQIHPVIEMATTFMRENPDSKISEVAKHCGVSESGIYLLFKKHAGKTPNDIRLEILCRKAVTLLSTTNKSVQEISDSLGFSSTSYFRRVLREHTGKTPLEIRKTSVF